ncbi:MAG: SDR family oxidoreductase [Bacteriovoracia bacterium]
MKMTKNTILITGGTSGIGFEFIRQLSDLDNTIIVTGRDLQKLERTKKSFPKIHTIQSDVSDPKAVVALYEQVTKQFPDLNILINNAGIMKTINVHDTTGTLTDLTQEIEINLNGPIRMVKQFLPHLKAKAAAAIVNVTSGLAFVPLPVSPVYCATKAGLHSYTLSLRVQLKNTKVKVFELAPPATQTELLGDLSEEDRKGISIMKVEDMVKVAVNGMMNDRFEIRPGQSNQLKMMSRIAPDFILKQMSRSVDRMLSKLD